MFPNSKSPRHVRNSYRDPASYTYSNRHGYGIPASKLRNIYVYIGPSGFRELCSIQPLLRKPRSSRLLESP